MAAAGGRSRTWPSGGPDGAAGPENAQGLALVQRVDDCDPTRAKEQALHDLSGGASGLALVFEGAPNAFGYGLPATPEALAAVLEDIPLHRTHLRIDVHPASRAMADWLVSLLTRKRVDPGKLSLSFGIDPAAIFAGTGRLRMSLEALQASMPPSLSHIVALGVPGVLLEADGRVFHNAGASAAQEIGIMMATANSHLRLFEQARQALVYAAPHIGFALSVDDDRALAAAKIAALRALWLKLQDSHSVPPSPATIHAETSYRMMSSTRPEANIAPAAAAADAAIAAGVDSISILPHTITRGLPAPQARRTALTSLLAAGQRTTPAEAADPGAVTELTESAWAEFRMIESEGGILRSLLSGALQRRIAAASRERVRPPTREGPGAGIVETLPARKRPLPADGTVFCERLVPALAEETEATETDVI